MSKPSAITEFIAGATAQGIAVRQAEPLARHTTFRIGGPADLVAVVGSVAQLAAVGRLAETCELPALVLGGGSNVLISDAGIRGLVILNQARSWRWADAAPADAADDTRTLVVASGAALAGLARWTIRQGWRGLEWAVSVPGAVGGAVIGNAGAHGGDMAGLVAWAAVAYGGQPAERLTDAALGYGYRSSALKTQLARGQVDGQAGPTPIVLEVGLRLARGDVEALTARAEDYLARRRASQPVEPSAGSVFRNPPGDHAGRLIEAAGLKGAQIGGAQISPRHANFIVNAGNATAADVVALIRLAQGRVAEMTGIALQPEILLIGMTAHD